MIQDREDGLPIAPWKVEQDFNDDDSWLLCDARNGLIAERLNKKTAIFIAKVCNNILVNSDHWEVE